MKNPLLPSKKATFTIPKVGFLLIFYSHLGHYHPK